MWIKCTESVLEIDEIVQNHLLPFLVYSRAVIVKNMTFCFKRVETHMTTRLDANGEGPLLFALFCIKILGDSQTPKSLLKTFVNTKTIDYRICINYADARFHIVVATGREEFLCGKRIVKTDAYSLVQCLRQYSTFSFWKSEDFLRL